MRAGAGRQGRQEGRTAPAMTAAVARAEPSGWMVCQRVLQCDYPTMALTRIKPKFQVTIPQAAREAVGLKIGDFLEATPTKEGVLLRPKQLVDRKVELDRRLDEALADVKAGRVSKPYKSARTLVRDALGRGRTKNRPVR